MGSLSTNFRTTIIMTEQEIINPINEVERLQGMTVNEKAVYMRTYG